MIFFYALLGQAGLAALQMVMGMVAGGFISLLWAIIRDVTPSRMLGLTSGMLNPAPFFGVAAFQVVTGAILDKAGSVESLYPVSGFKVAFSVCLLANLVCLSLSFLIRKTQPE
jgi:MFS family permease